IMFVSVKERTNIIGIKKALGARQNIILLEFLTESVLLCILGGILGLAVVLIATLVMSKVLEFDIYLSANNIITGIGLSVVIGILAGFIPALQAARMDPVEAIRK
ncbi:MAG TPA: FtsX-like permease family protein, partial [Saprospiraceae bacterium]|nr:FtsX-like permease family protein [Saprospiraceae bacterium]